MDDARLFGVIFYWVVYFIWVALVSHMVFTAYMARKDIQLSRAGAFSVHPTTEVAPAIATATAVPTAIATATATAVGTPVTATATATAVPTVTVVAAPS